MPVLSEQQAAELLTFAASYARCGICGHLTSVDYCRSCDEFYAIHAPDCPRYHHKHSGHRLTIVPFVEMEAREWSLDDELDVFLSMRAYNCLTFRKPPITTLAQLLEMTEWDLLRIKNLGRGTLKEIEDALARKRLTLKPWR